jgi:hypothetical protein
LLQEFDLPLGSTVIGRSLDCNLTIEDPLVSRQHARIVIDDEGGVVEDLSSRNGVRVNGIPVHSPTRLRDGDRVRIGTQDFVFCRVDTSERPYSKTTGVLRLCAKCRLPYPREMLACPNCEATEQTEEDTLSGSFGSENQSAWSVQLLVEALERALTLGRIGDADRIARRATSQFEEVAGVGGVFDARTLALLAVQVLTTTLGTNDPHWGLWVLDTYRRAGLLPPFEVVERLGEVIGRHPGVFSTPIDDLLERLNSDARARSVGPGALEIDALARLERFRGQLGEADEAGRPKTASASTAAPDAVSEAAPNAPSAPPGAPVKGEVAAETTGEWPGPS